MARDVTPNQTRYVDPYQQDVCQYNSADSKIYISRIVNSLLNALGNNIILDGFDISNVSFTATEVSVTVGSGHAIADQTLVKTTTDADLTYPNANLLDDSGKFILHINYKYLETLVSPTELDIRLSHVSPGGTVVSPDSWSAHDRIVIGIFDFVKDGGNITSFTQSSDYKIALIGTDYYIGGYDSSNVHISQFLSNIPDLVLYPNVFREGNGEIVYSADKSQVESIIHTLPSGVFQLDYTYDQATENVSTEKAYFRDGLLYTKTYSYDADNLLTSWVEV